MAKSNAPFSLSHVLSASSETVATNDTLTCIDHCIVAATGNERNLRSTKTNSVLTWPVLFTRLMLSWATLSFRSPLFWYVTKRKLVFTSVSGQPICPIFKGQAWHTLDDGIDGSPETWVTIILHYVTTQMSEDYLHRGGSLKSQYPRLVCVCVRMCTAAQQYGYYFKPQQKQSLLEYQNKPGSASSGTDYSTSTKQTNRVIRLFLLLHGQTKASLILPISQVTEISTTLTLTQFR